MKILYTTPMLCWLLGACVPTTTSTEANKPVTFTSASGEFSQLIAKLPHRNGFDSTSRTEKAEGGATHRMRRVAPSAVAKAQTKLHSECVRSHGGDVIRAQQSTFSDGDVGFLITCSN